MRRPIPPLDLLFYLMETHDNPKHVAGLQVFQLPADAGPGFLLDLVERLRRVPPVEPFNYRPRFPRLGVPQWETVSNMEMEYHLRHSALPAPGTMQQLLAVVRRLHAGVLDRDRPGWICQIIEGLEDNRFAVYTKVHHAYIDGMAGVKRMYGSLSPDPRSREVVPVWGYLPDADARPARPARRRSAVDLPRLLLRQARAAGEVGLQFLQIATELAQLSRPTGHIPFQAPRTPINDRVSSDLRSIGVTSMPLDRLRAVSRQAGCTINDVVLALTDAALHDYLARHGSDPGRPLVAMCPMSLRQPGDSTANSQLATLLVTLGRSGAGLRQRLEQVAASADRAKRDARAISRDGLIDFVLVIGGAFELLQRTGLDRWVPQSYNVLVSNVPGPGTEHMYLCGARLLASYPISTLTPGNNLNLTVLSHGNSVDFGLLAARGTLPDIDYLVERLDVQFARLMEEFGIAEAAGKRSAATGARRRRKTAAKRGGATERKAARPKTAARRGSPPGQKASSKPKASTRRRTSAKRRTPEKSGTAASSRAGVKPARSGARSAK